jgi:hypothetical protein
MLKHVGMHNNRKIVVLYRKVPGEDHMCLVAYSDAMPSLIHEEVMRCVEGPAGQAAESFADALFRVTMRDGRNALNTLHSEGFIKKVQTSQVTLTPTVNSRVQLDEINDIIDKINAGDTAVKKMQDLKEDPKVVSAGILSNKDLGIQRQEQAQRMRAQAEELLREAANLENEAQALILESEDKSDDAVATVKRAVKNARKKAQPAKI